MIDDDDLEDPPLAGDFGEYGGRYVAETLMPAVEELARAWPAAWADPAFRGEYEAILRAYVGRPTTLTEAPALAEAVSARPLRVLLKREDLAHTGAHKINNALGQALLTVRMGKGRVIAETGAGQHGVATATASALLGLECVVYMGTEDMRRQHPNVERMRLLGAKVVGVDSGSRTPWEASSDIRFSFGYSARLPADPTKPGETAFTRISSSANSPASARVSPRAASFETP